MKIFSKCFLYILSSVALYLFAYSASAQNQTKQYDEGSVYEGEFKNGLRHGQGKYTMPDGFIYEGTWLDDQIQGAGVARYPTGQIYEGQFKQGVPHGKGTMTFADGTIYDGSWLNGKMEGDGSGRPCGGFSRGKRCRRERIIFLFADVHFHILLVTNGRFSRCFSNGSFSY